jgi:predicted RNase H-like HicB family nuclease
MVKKLREKVYQYTAIFEPDNEEGGYTVTIPSLPGCISEGNNFEEALENIKEAAELYLEEFVNDKREIEEKEGVVVAPVQIRI